LEEPKTAQTNDKFIYKNLEYGISAIEFPNNFFNIEEYGLKPIWERTSCWRGYVATFTINDDNKLVLHKLNTNNGNRENDKIISINGKLPKIIKPEGIVDEYKNFRQYKYDNVDFEIIYNGSIIITSDFIISRYVHMGFQSPISYKNVISLTFNNGKFSSFNDLSNTVASIRDNEKIINLENKEMDDKEWIEHKMKWINDCFNISFDKI